MDASAARLSRPPALPGWRAELTLRARRLFVLKAVGITAFIWVFFIAYFHLLRHPLYPVVVMPLTALDRAVAFQPYALYAYLSLWFYVGIAPGLQRGFWSLIVYALWTAALCAAGLGIFRLWPTAVPPLVIDVTGIPGFATLQGVDAAGNACPSMHVAIAMFSAIRIEHLLRGVRAPAAWRAVNLAWWVAIAYSTLAIKQHVALDALAGALLGAAFALPSLRWRPGGWRADAAGRADIMSSRGASRRESRKQ